MPEDVQTRLELLHIVGAADVFVLPSLVEGLPMALLEAMALGVPAVASEINGVPEAVIDGVTGTLVRPGDAEDLEAKLTNLAADRGRALGLAEAGRRKVLNEFEETAVAEKVFKEYMKAHGGK
jgi:glycosyltransferase involved in cell wall biosynthesis